jgi:hypothetical protein
VSQLSHFRSSNTPVPTISLITVRPKWRWTRSFPSKILYAFRASCIMLNLPHFIPISYITLGEGSHEVIGYVICISSKFLALSSKTSYLRRLVSLDLTSYNLVAVYWHSRAAFSSTIRITLSEVPWYWRPRYRKTCFKHTRIRNYNILSCVYWRKERNNV